MKPAVTSRSEPREVKDEGYRLGVFQRAKELNQYVGEHCDELLEKAVKTLEARGCQAYVVRTAEAAAHKISEMIQEGAAGIYPDDIFQNSGILLQLNQMEVPLRRMDREGFSRESGMDALPFEPFRQAVKQATERLAFGLTGVDAVIANHGTLMILDEEGSRHSLSTLPYTHIAVADANQIVPDLPDAMTIARKLSLDAGKGLLTRYISLISGPSSTADVQGQNVRGMHGPKEVIVIILNIAKMEGGT